MSLVVLLGGARSGKSTLALELATGAGTGVTFVATAEARDDEMAARIAAHRAERPAGWASVEEPLELGRALAGLEKGSTCIVDCLTLWVSNMLLRGRDERHAGAGPGRELECQRRLAAPGAAEEHDEAHRPGRAGTIASRSSTRTTRMWAS